LATLAVWPIKTYSPNFSNFWSGGPPVRPVIPCGDMHQSTGTLVMAALCNRGHYVLSCGFFFLFSFYLFSSPNLSDRRLDVYLPYFYMVWPCEFRMQSELCCVRLAEKFMTQTVAKKSPSGHHCTTLSGYIFATKAHINNRKKTF